MAVPSMLQCRNARLASRSHGVRSTATALQALWLRMQDVVVRMSDSSVFFVGFQGEWAWGWFGSDVDAW